LSRGWAAGCAIGLAFVIGGELYDRLGVCTAPHCDRVYVDTSRNGSKRFCSTACQNRVKAAAFRERHA
jgi:predicted RNA-binding Zn ribbon-like protein